jgi:hypothetical protein
MLHGIITEKNIALGGKKQTSWQKNKHQAKNLDILVHNF